MNSFNSIDFKIANISPMGEKFDPAAPYADLLTVRAFAERAGLTPSAVYVAMKRGEVDFVKVGERATMIIWNNRAETYRDLPDGRRGHPRSKKQRALDNT